MFQLSLDAQMKPQLIRRSHVTDFRMCGSQGCNALAIYEVIFLDDESREGPHRLFCLKHYQYFVLHTEIKLLES